MTRVKAIPGEPTCFEVESSELQCSSPWCGKLVRRLPVHYVRFSLDQEAMLRALGVWGKVEKHLAWLEAHPAEGNGSLCPKCGAALELRWHRCDIAANDGVGHCACELFAFVHAPALARMSKSERLLASDKRCHHLRVARDFALDVALCAHSFERYVKAGRQREEATV